MSSEALITRKRCATTPNDPKLSDRGVRRGTCMGGGKAVVEAGAVTHGAVRCSAWLGDFTGLGQTPKKSSGRDARTRDRRPNVNVWKAETRDDAREGEKPKTAALSRRSELLRVKRLDATASR